MSSGQTAIEREQQEAKLKSYRAPESVHRKYDPKSTMIGQGKAFTGVSPMDFYMRKNADEKARKAKAAEEKQRTYK